MQTARWAVLYYSP